MTRGTEKERKKCVETKSWKTGKQRDRTAEGLKNVNSSVSILVPKLSAGNGSSVKSNDLKVATPIFGSYSAGQMTVSNIKLQFWFITALYFICFRSGHCFCWL